MKVKISKLANNTGQIPQVPANPRQISKEYLGYMWATDRTGKSLNIPEDGNDHILDAVKYKLVDLLYAPKIQFYGSLDRGAEPGRGAFLR